MPEKQIFFSLAKLRAALRFKRLLDSFEVGHRDILRCERLFWVKENRMLIPKLKLAPGAHWLLQFGWRGFGSVHTNVSQYFCYMVSIFFAKENRPQNFDRKPPQTLWIHAAKFWKKGASSSQLVTVLATPRSSSPTREDRGSTGPVADEVRFKFDHL